MSIPDDDVKRCVAMVNCMSQAKGGGLWPDFARANPDRARELTDPLFQILGREKDGARLIYEISEMLAADDLERAIMAIEERRRPPRRNLRTAGIAIMVPVLALVIIGIPLYMNFCNDPAARIAENSKTPACAAALIAGLDQLAAQNGLAFRGEQAQVRFLFEEGKVAVGYTRDGISNRFFFGLKATPKGCRLVHYRREIREPGRSRNSTGDFGSVQLEGCRCTQ